MSASISHLYGVAVFAFVTNRMTPGDVASLLCSSIIVNRVGISSQDVVGHAPDALSKSTFVGIGCWIFIISEKGGIPCSARITRFSFNPVNL